MKTIVFTGGGTAGHVTPNLALIERLDRSEWNIHYIGTADGIEAKLIADCKGIDYHAVAWGKLRRYFSVKNFTDPFRVIKGYFQSVKIMKDVKPDVLFSKGGYVSVPVVMAARGKCPVIVHESDFSPGLANRIASKFADTVCVSFRDTLDKVPKNKGVYTGTPIRSRLFTGDRARALKMTGLSGEKPVLLMMGGSTGAVAVNEKLRHALPLILKDFDVVHLTGKGNQKPELETKGSVQYEYINEELPDLFALADIVLSRAGANAVFELVALHKPALYIPLPLEASRGDQILNANYCCQHGYGLVLMQSETNDETLTRALSELYNKRDSFVSAMKQSGGSDAADNILKLIFKAAKV